MQFLNHFRYSSGVDRHTCHKMRIQPKTEPSKEHVAHLGMGASVASIAKHEDVSGHGVEDCFLDV